MSLPDPRNPEQLFRATAASRDRSTHYSTLSKSAWRTSTKEPESAAAAPRDKNGLIIAVKNTSFYSDFLTELTDRSARSRSAKPPLIKTSTRSNTHTITAPAPYRQTHEYPAPAPAPATVPVPATPNRAQRRTGPTQLEADQRGRPQSRQVPSQAPAPAAHQ